MAKYRAAIIGCGGIARAHMTGYKLVPAVEVVAGADPFPEARTKFEAEFPSVKTYQDAETMLAAEKPDIVSICTWPGLHGALCVTAAEAGAKGIVCEKPFDLTLPAADAALEACRANGTKLIVGHQRRFYPHVNEAREALQAGAIGELVSVTSQCMGDLYTDATHSIDLIRYFVEDEPVDWVLGQVARYSDKHRFGHDVEDAALVHLQFHNGVRGLVMAGDLVEQGVYQHVHLQGTEGRIEVGGDREQWWRLMNAETGGWEQHDPAGDLREQIWDCFAGEIAELVEWIEGGPGHRLNGDSARNTLEIIIAAFESSRRRAKIALPLEGVDGNPLAEMIAAGAFN